MITVRFFGLLRLDSGVKTVEVKAKNMTELFRVLEQKSQIPVKTLKGCKVFINGKPKKFNQKLRDGDEIMFLVPSCGG